MNNINLTIIYSVEYHLFDRLLISKKNDLPVVFQIALDLKRTSELELSK